MAWHNNPAIAQLKKQLLALHPGMVIGTIGDAAHSSETSDHNPDADGTVDALDAMLGPAYGPVSAQSDVDSLVRSRDKRIHYVIYRGMIISSTVEPWVWRKYEGSDPHVNHWHLSTRDQYEASTVEWKLYMPTTVTQVVVTGHKPALRKGMQDEDGAVRHIWRIQKFLGVTADGVFGSETDKALKGFLGSSYTGVLDLQDWQKILGLW